MRLAGSTLIHTSLPLEDTLLRIRELGFQFIEIDFFDWAHFDPDQVIGNEPATAERIRTACKLASLTPIALSLGLHGSLEQQMAQMTASSRVASQLDISYLTFQAAAKDTPLEIDFERARQLRAIAQEHGRTLGIETHFFVHTDDPRVARRYVQEVSGLYLTLDPSHYEAGPHWSLGYHDLFPYVRYVHIRSAGRGSWDEIQQPAGSGVINYERLFQILHECGFKGDASIEYVEGAPGIKDASTEARRMRELIESLV